jgi:hypothetical protein
MRSDADWPWLASDFFMVLSCARRWPARRARKCEPR